MFVFKMFVLCGEADNKRKKTFVNPAFSQDHELRKKPRHRKQGNAYNNPYF